MPDLERILQNTPGTLSQQWYESGVAVDPGTVTIGVTRADDTVLVAAGTATTGSGTAARTFNVTTTHTALLDRLKVTWTSTLKGTLVSYVEVVGGFLFSLADALALVPTATAAAASDARTYAETEIEHDLGYSLVPRYALEALTPRPSGEVKLRNQNIRTIRSVTVGGQAYSAGQIADLNWLPSGCIYGFWPWFQVYARSIVIGYEHGTDYPPPGASSAALALAANRLSGTTGTNIDPRAVSIVTQDGTIQFSPSNGQFVGVSDWTRANRAIPTHS